jgi:hypothetical protein
VLTHLIPGQATILTVQNLFLSNPLAAARQFHRPPEGFADLREKPDCFIKIFAHTRKRALKRFGVLAMLNLGHQFSEIWLYFYLYILNCLGFFQRERP